MVVDKQNYVGAGYTWTNIRTQEIANQFFNLSDEPTIYDAEWWGMFKGIKDGLKTDWSNGVAFTDSKSTMETFMSIQDGKYPFYEKILNLLNYT